MDPGLNRLAMHGAYSKLEIGEHMTSDERANIVALLREHDGNRNRVSKLVGRHASTVGRIANEEGIESKSRNIAATKKANEARSAYAEERRLEIIGKGFDKADELLKAIVEAGEFQKWTVGLGTLVDKARLETGEATHRGETIDPERRRKMKENLDEVAAQRRKNVDRRADTG